jgi:hypothetical protein
MGHIQDGHEVYSSLRGVCDVGQLLAIGKKAGYSYSDILSGVDFSGSEVKSELKKFLASVAKFQPVKDPVVAREVATWVISGKELEKEVAWWGLKNPEGIFSKVEVLGVDLDGSSKFKVPVKSGWQDDTDWVFDADTLAEFLYERDSDIYMNPDSEDMGHTFYADPNPVDVAYFVEQVFDGKRTVSLDMAKEALRILTERVRSQLGDFKKPLASGKGRVNSAYSSNYSSEDEVLDAFLAGELNEYDAAREIAYGLWGAGDHYEEGKTWDDAVAIVDSWVKDFGLYSSFGQASTERGIKSGLVGERVTAIPSSSGKGREVKSGWQDEDGGYEDDEYEDPVEPEEGDIVVNEYSYISEVGGRWSVPFEDWDQAEQVIKEKMERDQYWPNIWLADDHGRYTLTSIDSSVSHSDVK